MQFLAKVIAAILAVLFMIAAVAALLLFNLERRAFSPEIYQQVFAEEDFYNRIPTLLAETLINPTPGQAGLPFVLQGVSLQDAETFLRAILPADVLTQMGDDTLNSVFAYANQQADVVQVSLIPLKTNLTSETSVAAIFGLLANQPPCTTEQLLNMTVMLLQQQIAFCNPPAELQPLITPVLQLQLQAASVALPESVILLSADPNQGLNDPRERLRTARAIMGLSPMVALGLLFPYFLLTVLSFKNWLDWLGIPFLIAGGSASLIGLLGGPVIRFGIQEILVRNMPAYFPVILLDYTGQLAEAITNEFLSPVIIEGLLFAALGIGMLAVSFILKQRGRWY